jgi:hypothetical protein
MPENDDTGQNVDQSRSIAEGPELIAAPTEPPTDDVRTAILKLSDICARELTEEEKSEERRRRTEIQAGRHPDTGKRLQPGDRKTLKPRDLYAFQMYYDWKLTRFGASYLDPFNRSMIEAQEYRDRSLSIYAANHLGNFHDPMHDWRRDVLTNPMWNNSLIGVDHQSNQSRVVEASFGHRIGAPDHSQFAQIDRDRRFLDPLFDPDFVRRITGDTQADLIRRASDLHDQMALRSLRETVESSATSRMVDQWQMPFEPRWTSAIVKETDVAFEQQSSLMAIEAERMLSIYGPRIAEQSPFLTEYRSNLGLFQPGLLNLGAFQAADLLARVALSPELVPGFEYYQVERVERLRAYGRVLLAELEEDFKRKPNPLFVFKARGIAQSCGLEQPEWVDDQLDGMTDGVLAIEDSNEDGPGATEAELVGKALGFSRQGKGQTGWFAHAKQVQRDREIYLRVEELLAERKLQKPKFRPKITRVRAEVADEFDVDETTVRRAHRNFSDYVGKDDESET